MSGDIDALVRAGTQALESGDFASAQRAFEAAGDSPAALMGLAGALAWQGDNERAVQSWQRAYGAYRRGPEADPAQAAEAAINLALIYNASLGNDAAARGWTDRLARLVDDCHLEPVRGWVHVLRALLNPHDAAGAEASARAALDLARTAGDGDLELCALCELGVAVAAGGRVEKGLALLGEAMAGSLGGEAARPDTVVYCCCRMIVTCSAADEADRAAQWIRAAAEFGRNYGFAHLHALCRAHYGGVLFATGRWEEAEAELLEALRMSREAERVVRAEALARLAELRVAQGRAEEAAQLLRGVEDEPVVATARAALHLARGEPEAAAAVAARRVRALSGALLEAAPSIELLTQAETAAGAVAGALARARQLVEAADRVDCETVRARGERAVGRCLIAHGAAAAAVEHLERALASFARRGLPYEASRTRLLLARALAADRPQAAVAEGRGALDGFEQLRAGPDADAAAALLRSLGVKAARSGPRGLELLTKREAEVLDLLAAGLSNNAIAERLFLSRKTVEHHVHNVLLKLGLSGRAEAAAYVAGTRGAK